MIVYRASVFAGRSRLLVSFVAQGPPTPVWNRGKPSMATLTKGSIDAISTSVSIYDWQSG